MARACNTDGCLGLCEPGRYRCPAHDTEPERNRRHNTRRRAVTGDGAARRMRARVNSEGGARCEVCTHWRDAHAIHIDHIVAIADGGTDYDFNVRPICTDCHGDKTRAENRARSGRASATGGSSRRHAPRVADRLPDDVLRERRRRGRP